MKINLIGVSAAVLFAPCAQLAASQERLLSFRGGLSFGVNGYPVAFDELAEDGEVFGDYGTGSSLGLSFKQAKQFYGMDVEYGISVHNLSGSTGYGALDGAGICNTYFLSDLISLSHNECMNGVSSESDTAVIVMNTTLIKHSQQADVDLLFSLSTLDAKTESAGEMFYATEPSIQLRQSVFSGVGFTVGARKDIAVGQSTLRMAAETGLYFGERTVEVADLYLTTVDELLSTQSATARSLDFEVSIRRPLQITGQAGWLEFGFGYHHYDGVFDTSNYNATTSADPGVPNLGSESDNLDILELFVGTGLAF